MSPAASPDPHFDRAVAFTLRWEGGLVHHPADRGGRTNWGITAELAHAHLPARRVEDLTLTEAREVYRAEFWTRPSLHRLPWPVSLAAFDFAVNSGPGVAVRALQACVGTREDGQVGPLTLDRAHSRPPLDLALDLTHARVARLLDLIRRDPSQWPFARGWLRRCVALAAECARA